MTYRFTEVSPGAVHLSVEPSQPAPPDWGRVRVRACGLCGTDLHLLEGMTLPRGATYPVRPGHEVAGDLVEAKGRTAIGLREPVILHPLIPCGDCAACRNGHEGRCRTAAALGVDRRGGLADEILWPLSRMVPAPGIDPDHAAILADAGATAYHAMMLAVLPAGGALTVLGAGGVGTLILQIARALDATARLTAVVRTAATAQRLEDLGLALEIVHGVADCGRRIRAVSGAQDAVIEFGAGAASLRETPVMLGRGGRLVIGSIDDGPLELGTTLAAVATRELQVLGSYASTIDDLRAVVDLARSGRLDLAAAVSHRLALADVAEAFGLLRERPPGLARIVVLP